METWAVDMAKVGAIYPWQGVEVIMVIAGIGGWYFGKTSEENRYRVETPTDIEDVEFTLPDVRGTTRSSSEWEGKARLINFWATWCRPCVADVLYHPRRSAVLYRSCAAEVGHQMLSQRFGFSVFSEHFYEWSHARACTRARA